jgi:hypothetical protein
MNGELFLEYIILAYSAIIMLVLWKPLWRNLGAGTRIVFGFTLGMYALSYLAGVLLLFVGREALIDKYYSGALPAPHATPYSVLLTIAVLPLPVVSLSIWLFHRRGKALIIDQHDGRDGDWSDRYAVLITIGLALFLTRGILAELMANALNGITQTGGLIDLYARRMATFEALSTLQGGMIYGSIPACAALLLFQNKSVWRYFGIIVTALTLLLNIGLFQIGPILAFGLTILLIWLLLSKPNQSGRKLIIAFMTGFGIFSLYQGLKGDSSGQILTHLLLRMPIALPYLWEYSQVSPLEIAASDSLSHDLGEFMFPELRRLERFVAMPQPAFIAAYFQYGLTASIVLLFLIGIGLALIGQMLDRSRQRRQRVWIAVSFTPVMYYLFQVDIANALISSYSFIFSLLPVAISLGLRKLLVRKNAL